jgi:TonB family protein
MTRGGEYKSFKKAVYVSVSAHVALFLLIIASPSLPKSSRKGLIYYTPISLLGPGGGGGGGGGGKTLLKATQTPPARKETLRDLTVPQKVKSEAKPAMRYPVEKPKREAKTKTEKKAAITKPSPEEPAASGDAAGGPGGQGPGVGSGLRIGTGSGPGGSGFGDFSGLANFPFTWYLQILTDKVSTNWFTSLVDPGVSGNFQTIIFFKIQKDGQISELKIEASSGLDPLDLSALRAVRASSPFPPLPRDYEEAYLAIHLIFEHSK